MKAALICFMIALVIGAIFNSLRGVDIWGTTQVTGTPANEVASVSESAFEREVLSSPQPVLVDFYSDENEASRSMVPVIAACAKEAGASLRVVRVDATESPQLTKLYGVSKLPDFLLFKQGQEIDHLQGPVSKSDLLAFAQKGLESESGAEAGAPEILEEILGRDQHGRQPQSDGDGLKHSRTQSQSAQP